MYAPGMLPAFYTRKKLVKYVHRSDCGIQFDWDFLHLDAWRTTM
jgi:hypothetical protein